MNPVFWLGVILLAVALWFSLSYLFPSIGRSIKDLIQNTKSDIDTDIVYENEEKQEEDNHEE